MSKLDATAEREKLVNDIGDAWVECLRAIPDRWQLRLEANTRGTYYAVALPPFLPYDEWMVEKREGFGDSPGEALDELRIKLYDRSPGGDPA